MIHFDHRRHAFMLILRKQTSLVMKRLIITTLMLISMTSYTWAQNSTEKTSTLMIILHKGHLEKAPRTPGMSPITCEYHSGALIVRYLEDVGDLEIMVTNMQTGETISTLSSSMDEITRIYLTEDTGDYYLEIKISDGKWYYAYFSIYNA